MAQRWTDVPMVDIGTPEPLRLPRSAAKGELPIRYLVHSGKGSNHRCQDCLEMNTEYYADGGRGKPPPLARNAISERVQGTDRRILCAEHRDLRKELEARR